MAQNSGILADIIQDLGIRGFDPIDSSVAAPQPQAPEPQAQQEWTAYRRIVVQVPICRRQLQLKKKRRRLTRHEQNVLEEVFAIEPKPSTARKQELADMLGGEVDSEQVDNWFRNKRFRYTKPAK